MVAFRRAGTCPEEDRGAGCRVSGGWVQHGEGPCWLWGAVLPGRGWVAGGAIATWAPPGTETTPPPRLALHTPGDFLEPRAGVEGIHSDFGEQGNGVLVPGNHTASPLCLLPPGL